MSKTEAIRAVLSATTDQPVVFTTGYTCRIAKHLADRPGHFYMTGSMGLAASIATGIALATGRTAVVVDGDGSLLMNPSCLVTAGKLADLPLVHVVLDDHAYSSTGGQATPSARVDLAALARANGYPAVHRTTERAHFAALLREALLRSAPSFVQCILTELDERVPARINLDLADHTERLSRHILASS